MRQWQRASANLHSVDLSSRTGMGGAARSRLLGDHWPASHGRPLRQTRLWSVRSEQERPFARLRNSNHRRYRQGTWAKVLCDTSAGEGHRRNPPSYDVGGLNYRLPLLWQPLNDFASAKGLRRVGVCLRQLRQNPYSWRATSLSFCAKLANFPRDTGTAPANFRGYKYGIALMNRSCQRKVGALTDFGALPASKLLPRPIQQ
jgi:hypothetical protein